MVKTGKIRSCQRFEKLGRQVAALRNTHKQMFFLIDSLLKARSFCFGTISG